MCDDIYDRTTERSYGTPRQLRELVGAELLPTCEDALDEGCCLCPVDVAGILTAAGLDYECEYGMCYYIATAQPAHSGQPGAAAGGAEEA